MQNQAMTLPIDSKARKDIPIYSGCLRYFPAALALVASISKIGNDKHNPGEALHHARGKSMDHGDCILRHLIDMEDFLSVGKLAEAANGAAQVAWRALAICQELAEQAGSPLAPGAKKANSEFRKVGLKERGIIK